FHFEDEVLPVVYDVRPCGPCHSLTDAIQQPDNLLVQRPKVGSGNRELWKKFDKPWNDWLNDGCVAHKQTACASWISVQRETNDSKPGRSGTWLQWSPVLAHPMAKRFELERGWLMPEQILGQPAEDIVIGGGTQTPEAWQ